MYAKYRKDADYREWMNKAMSTVPRMGDRDDYEKELTTQCGIKFL